MISDACSVDRHDACGGRVLVRISEIIGREFEWCRCRCRCHGDVASSGVSV